MTHCYKDDVDDRVAILTLIDSQLVPFFVWKQCHRSVTNPS